MRTFFLFHDDWTQWIKADIAASLYPFDGFLVIRRTRPWWGKYLWKRVQRVGPVKVLNEVLYRLFYLIVHGVGDHAILKDFLKQQQRLVPAVYNRPPVYRVDDINSDDAMSLLKNELRPDVCVLMVNVILKEKIFSIPPLGMLVFHPGLTPEYRGPHSAFWATYNRQFWGIGWSLLRVDAGIDTGTVLEQDTVRSVDPLTETHIVMQHKAHVYGIPKMAGTLEKLAVGGYPTISQEGRESTNYTHPGFLDFLRHRKVLKQLRAESSVARYWTLPFEINRKNHDTPACR
jgi:folate-dependent phosphoribosylglycinamide formyltransferase PurN